MNRREALKALGALVAAPTALAACDCDCCDVEPTDVRIGSQPLCEADQISYIYGIFVVKDDERFRFISRLPRLFLEGEEWFAFSATNRPIPDKPGIWEVAIVWRSPCWPCLVCESESYESWVWDRDVPQLVADAENAWQRRTTCQHDAVYSRRWASSSSEE